MNMANNIPTNPSELTVEWLASALHSKGALNLGPIGSLEFDNVSEGHGFASHVYRVHLNGGSVLPTMIAKFSLDRDEMIHSEEFYREMYEREAMFYEELRDQAGARVPTCYYSAYDRTSGRSILLLEDIISDAPNRILGRNEMGKIQSVLSSLAGMHAKWWDRIRGKDKAWLRPFPSHMDEPLVRLTTRRDEFLACYKKVLSREAIDMTMRLGTSHAALFEPLLKSPKTLIHFDCHSDNMIFTETGEDPEVVIIDWQRAGVGPAATDVARFLSSSVDGGPQNSDNDRMLKFYHSALVNSGVKGLSFDEFTSIYRLSILRWWVAVVNSTPIPDEGRMTQHSEVHFKGVARWSHALDLNEVIRINL